MAYTIEQIENAILTALRAITTVTIRTVDTYGGELDEDAIKRLVQQSTSPLPAVYIVWGGSGWEPHGGRKIEKPVFDLLAIDRSLRARDEGRRGGSGNPGVYAMLAAIRNALCGHQLGLEISPLELLREEPVWVSGPVNVYGASYETMQPHFYPAA